MPDDPVLDPLVDHWRQAAGRAGVAIGEADLAALARQTLATVLAGPLGDVVVQAVSLHDAVRSGAEPGQTERRALMRAVRELLEDLPADHPVRRRVG